MTSHMMASLKGRQDLINQAATAKQRLGGIIHAELKPLFARFVDKTQEQLLRPATANHNTADERKNAELARKMKNHAATWCEELLAQVERRVFMQGDGKAAGDDQDSERANASLIAMAKALLIAETKYFKRIAELDARMNRVRLIMDLSVDTKSLAPTGLHQALVQVGDKLEWPKPSSALLYSCFEVHVIANLEHLYDQLLAAMRDIGRDAAQAVVESTFDVTALVEESEREDGAARLAEIRRDWMKPPSSKLEVDSQTASMLTRLALEDSGDGEGYSDGLLAADLLALMDKRPLPGISHESAAHSVERTSLAGHFLNQVKADPMVEKSKGFSHESLRMALVKSAITDNSLLTDASHPLASLIDEHMTRAARHRLKNVEEAQDIEDSLSKVLSLFDLSPDFVRESMAKTEPLKDDQIERFYALQRQQAAQRKEFVINEAKRIAAEEIERCCFARDVPAPAQRFLQKAWGALLTQRLLKYGASDEIWLRSIAEADELVDLLEARDGKAPPPPEWVKLIKAMADDLVKSGLPAEQRGNIIRMLEAARKSP